MRLNKTMLGVSAALALSAGVAQASPVNLSAITTGSYEVAVWTGKGTPDTATAQSIPGTTPDASFLYTGPIDFVNTAPNNGQNASLNTFADFGFSTSNISNFSSPTLTLSQFLNTTMSLAGFSDNSLLAFLTEYSTGAGTTLTLTHDDGASAYTLSDGPLNTVIYSPGPNSPQADSGMLPSGDNYLGIVYVEANGSPSVLTATVSGQSVPEPGTFALLGAGLLGLGWAMRRRKAL